MLHKLGLVVLIATVGMLAFAPGAGRVSAAATALYVSQSCAGSTVSGAFSWQGSDPNAQQQWLDLSLSDNGFAPGTFISAGPFTASQTSYTWSGLSNGAGHFVRVNQQLADGSWDASQTFQFTALACGAGPAPAAPVASALPFNKQRVDFQDPQGLNLVGFVYKPDGPGPFPAIIWNHGSEKNPGIGPEFDNIANVFVPAGYVVMAPMREGHGLSQGQYIGEVTSALGPMAANQQLIQLLAGPQLDDQLAGLALLKTMPYVDPERIAVTGCSYGGMETLLGAERGAGYKVAVALSPGAESWGMAVQRRLLQAVGNIQIPTYLIQPSNDLSLGPSQVLGPELTKTNPSSRVKVFPPDPNPDLNTHCFGGPQGDGVWAQEALRFIAQYIGH